MKKLKLNPKFLLISISLFFYYAFLINITLNSDSKLFGMFAYFLAILPIVSILIDYFLIPKNNIEPQISNENTTEIKPVPNIIEEKNETPIEITDESLEKNTEKNNIIFSLLSHEIRSIMTGVTSVSQVLSEPKLSKKDKQELLGLLNKSSIELLSLVDDILDFSKIENGHLKLNETIFSPYKIIQNKVQILKPSIPSDISISFESSVDEHQNYLGDQNKISQMLSNLINNSLKYTKSGDIFISVKEVEYNQEHKISTLEFSVADTGKGINEQDIPKMFSPYTQIEQDKNIKSTGLGLYILKTYAQTMGGDAWINSVEGQGTEVFFTVKLQKSEQAEEKEAFGDEEAEMMASMLEQDNTEQKESKKEKGEGFILISEKNSINKEFLEIFLNKVEIKSKIVKTSEDAFISYTQDYCYDLILLNNDLTHVNEINKIREWELKYEKPPIPIFILTSSNHNEEDYESLNISGFITKPIKTMKLKEAISKYLMIS